MRKKAIFDTGGNSISEVFELFLLSKRAEGVTGETVHTYQTHFKSLSSLLDTEKSIENLTKKDLQDLVKSLLEREIQDTTVSSYVRTFKTFLSWAKREGYSNATMPPFKCSEPVKETYTTEQLKRLLIKPNIKACSFSEFRNWVIVNLLVNSGCRAATIREIRIADLDLSNSLCMIRHNKSRKVQTIPLCAEMVKVLKEYLLYRKGKPEEMLFVTETGEPMSKNTLYLAISRYNKRRGVSITSIHAFRHTFSRYYLLNGGNPFMLQKILNHSTLDMTKHYCKLYNTDMLNGFDELSPLMQFAQKPHIKMTR